MSQSLHNDMILQVVIDVYVEILNNLKYIWSFIIYIS